MIKVSVIVPCYNVEQYLEKCLDSIINQTLKEIEIICVNDGSKDNTLKILEQYASKDERIKIISQENKGLSGARNVGIKEAKGEYIGFVDSDDWIDSDFFEKLYNAAKKYNSDVASANIMDFKDGEYSYRFKNKKLQYSAMNVKERYKLCDIPRHCYVWNKIYERRKFLEFDVWFKEGKTFEDIEFTHKVLYYYSSLVTVPDTNYYYRYNSFSIANFNTEKKMKDYLEAYYSSLKFMQNSDINYICRNNRYPWEKRKTFFVFGFPVLSIKHFGNRINFYLFNIILIFSIRTTERDFLK